MTRLIAVQAASNALNELGIDQSSPVDPFEAIEDLGLVLAFKPLKDLLGVILPGSPAGVMINSARPATLQRYTAAHELGHWYLHRDSLSLDTQDAVLGNHYNAARELDAQVFAAHFLMPLELLHPTIRRYDIKSGIEAQPDQVYQVARDMHVSYEATVRHLVGTRIITDSNGVRLLKSRPAMIKQRLTGGLQLPDARGDIWILEPRGEQAEIEAFIGDAIMLKLVERPSTGYRWCADSRLQDATVHQLPEPPFFAGARAFSDDLAHGGELIPFPISAVSSEVISLLGDTVLREPYQKGKTAVGSAVTRVVTYAAEAPGRESIQLSETRPTQAAAPVSHLHISAIVRGKPEFELRQRLLMNFAAEEADAEYWDA